VKPRSHTLTEEAEVAGMRKFHLFEFIDLTWWPDTLRDFETDAVQHFTSESYDAAVPKLRELLTAAGVSEVVDLCSGASGPWPRLLPMLGEGLQELAVKLTDKFPNRSAVSDWQQRSDPNISYHPEPVAADAVPEALDGLRTVFSGFHHLRPPEAEALLCHAVERRVGVGIFDGTSARTSLGALIKLLLVVPIIPVLFYLSMIFATPKLKPVTFSRVLWCCVIPVVPLTMTWDVIVTLLRAYTEDELRAMTRAADPERRYRWEVGTVSSGRSTVTYLTGLPPGAEASGESQRPSP
jgi:hypothetical protein